MFRCATCGSDEIWTKQWVNPNTGELGDSTSDGEYVDNFCDNCDGHVDYIEVKETPHVYALHVDTTQPETVEEWVDEAREQERVYTIEEFCKQAVEDPEEFKKQIFKIL